MTLRRRLLLSVLLTAVPLVAGAVWLRLELSRHAWEQAFRDVAEERIEAWGKEACEAAPDDPRARLLGRPRAGAWYAGRRRGRARFALRTFVYDREYRPSDPQAPPFPEDLKKALESGNDAPSKEVALGQGPRRLLVALRTGWDDGPCAVVLAVGPPPLLDPPLRGLVALAVVLGAAFLVAVWIAAGSVVRPVRALTAAVRRSTATHYDAPVGVAASDEIAELASAFDHAAAEIRDHVARVEAREQALRSFVANTTHDVMLPLTVLQGHLTALQHAAQEGRCDPAAVEDAREEAHYLASLIHNLGTAAKLEAADLPLEQHPVNLNELVERAAGRHRPIAAPKGIELNSAVPEQPLWTRGDVTLIEQAVSNVIHNAVRYNRPGGHVAVVLEPVEGSRFRLTVVDDGPGVSDDELRRLGERRYRADEARTRSPSGQGLGLSIAREVATRHRFDMAIRRSEAGGLEVEFQGDLAP